MSDVWHAVILCASTSHAIRAERLLDKADIDNKLIPVPRHLSSDCGVCLRIGCGDVETARKVLKDSGVRVEGIHRL